MIPCWGMMKPNKYPVVTQETYLRGFNQNLVLFAPLKRDEKVYQVLGMLIRFGRKVIQVS